MYLREIGRGVAAEGQSPRTLGFYWSSSHPHSLIKSSGNCCLLLMYPRYVL